jgi:hypothetical protein
MELHDYPPLEIPPRPEGGYPDEFFASWGEDPKVWAHWFRCYHVATGGDPHDDLGRYLDRTMPGGWYPKPVQATPPTQVISTRLPHEDVAWLDGRAAEAGHGKRGEVLRELVQWARRREAS